MGILRDYNEGRMDNLRSISYAESRTQSPYVTKDINNPPNADGLSLPINKRLDDTSRIAQMLVDRPGLKHLGNEALLSQVDVDKKIAKAKRDGKTTGGAILQQIGGTVKHVAQVAGSTLAQIPVNGTGTHFLRGFRTDTYLQTNEQNSAFAEFFGAGGVEGAKEVLAGNPVPHLNTITNSTLGNNTTAKPGDLGVSNEGIEPDGLFITNSEPIAVPGAAVETTARRGEIGINNPDNSGDYSGETSTLENKPAGAIQDFREVKEDLKSYSLNYGDPLINKETRVGLGNQGKIGRVRTSYTDVDIDTVDKINNLDVSTNKSLNGITENRDLIQLEFQIITPEDTHYLAFRAFLDTFDDSFNGSWNSNKYLGRAESFYTYSGFERSINIGFKIAAASSVEMEPLYRKAATLASVTAPTYGEGGRFMRGSIAKVTVGDYIYEQPGIIESVNYTWQKNYPWEISFQNPEGNERTQVLPHVLDVSLSFKVIHDFLPETGIVPLITNHRPISANKNVFIPLNNG